MDDQEPLPTSARPRVLLLCSPCMGHLIPFAELARRLVSDHGLAATLLFAAATSPPSEQYLALAAAVPDGVDLVALPAPPRDALPPSAPAAQRAMHAVAHSVPRVRSIARSSPLAALVVDMVGAPARGVADELGVPCYMFFTSPWMLLSLLLHLPELDAAQAGRERWDAAEPVRLPGCLPIQERDLPGSMLADRSSEAYARFMAMARSAPGFDAILVNTFRELEPAVGQGADGVTVHAVGPLVWTRPAGLDRDESCVRWLDQQPRGSVVYLSFGSGGTLTWRQTAELAMALEMSQRRFIWAVKEPQEDTPNGAFFGTRQGGGDLGFLPEGFVERTAGAGLVLRSWAPQTAILAHAAVGCFVTHCGWNSALESVLNGVPMVAWPLYAEQKMNAAMLEVQAGVAVRVSAGGPEGFVSKEEVASAMGRVMDDGEEGERLRRRAGELRDRAAHALSKEGGSSLALENIARAWRSATLPVENEEK